MKSGNSSNSGKPETFYDTLGVEEKCSQDDIKKAYRKLSFMHHPDKNGNSTESTEKFQKISEAFSVLGDPDERVKYDMNRNNPFANIGGMGGMGGGAAAAGRRRRHGGSLQRGIRTDLRGTGAGMARLLRPCRTWTRCRCTPGA